MTNPSPQASAPYPMVGVIFFSILTKKSTGSWISSRENEWEDHVKNILDPDRLKFRMKLLSEVIIPQLVDQTLKPDSSWFRLVIITSNMLPDQFKTALYQAVEPYPWIQIQERGPDDWLAAEKAVADSIKSMPCHYDTPTFPFFSFRVDDDDFLPLNYLENTQKYVRHENVNKLITYDRGEKILWDMETASICNIEKNVKAFLALGLGAVCEADTSSKAVVSEVKSVYVGKNHFELSGDYSHIVDNTESMYIWSHHASQDTFGRFKSTSFTSKWEEPPQDIEHRLAMYPHLIKFIQR
ncbi:glycosyltransferase [Pseudomonas juntendi]|uniref:glycosyltransferase n=1 Tax=Pseudomonas juntendi TaxID=2666183 RepID=UPI00244D1088|nr:glycosyltransferase [Pseudomonas juntendi]MDG9888154.1 putative rhamnosyl transferase [Pseudomonas juntendi]